MLVAKGMISGLDDSILTCYHGRNKHEVLRIPDSVVPEKGMKGR